LDVGNKPTRSLNIQGILYETHSNNGEFLAHCWKDECTFQIKGQTTPITYNESMGNIISVAVSNIGIVAITSEFLSCDLENSACEPQFNLVHVINLFSDDISTSNYDEVWREGFGKGLSITPSASRLAIGSPSENSVYIYQLKNDSIDISTRKMIKNDSSFISKQTVKSFGEKLALSESGKSLAVADSNLQNDSPNDKSGSGAIFVYYTNQRGEWEQLELVLYGSSFGLSKLGLGGVAIDEVNGLVHTMDKNGHYSHFAFDVRCRDPHASAIGDRYLLFRPQCQCNVGYKVSVPREGNVLTEPTDLCIVDTGSVQLLSPTAFPTSRVPSASPSVSMHPSMVPTTSLYPSSNPTTAKPTMSPTKSSMPSDAPTAFPTRLKSVYDGNFCRSDRECRSGKCSNSMCEAKVSFPIALECLSSFHFNAILIIEYVDIDDA
jgi:hypothetical protein